MLDAKKRARFSLMINDFKHNLQVLRFTGKECISQPYAFEIELVTDSRDMNPNDLLHKLAFLAFNNTDDGIHGQIHCVGKGSLGNGLTRYSVTLVPRLAYLDHRTNCRIFQQITVPQIIAQVLEGHGIHRDFHQFQLGSVYPDREYCVQYMESDLAFIQRLCQEEGLHYHFQHSCEKHVMVFGDDQTVFPHLDRPTPFKHDNGLVAETPAINHFDVQVKAGTNRTTRRDYDFKKARILLEAESKSDILRAQPDLEDYQYPGRFTQRDRGKLLSRREQERHGAECQEARGKSDQPMLLSGHFLPLSEHPDEEWNDLWLLTEIEHEGAQPQVLQQYAAYTGTCVENGFQGYRNQFHATPWDVIYRSPLTHDKPRIAGVQSAVVTGPKGEEIHCDDYGRVKVQFFWDREGRYDDKSSCWLRVSSLLAGNAFGGFAVPRVGMEVQVTFQDGDPDHPEISGCLPNSANPVPYELPANKTRSVFRSRSSPDSTGFSELHVEDRAGQELIYLRAQRDMEQRIENDSRLEVGNEQRTTVKGDSVTVLQATEHRTTIGDRHVQLNANDFLQVTGNSHTHVDQTLAFSAGRVVVIEADLIILKAGTKVTIEAGGEHLQIGGGGIFGSSELQIGGAPMRVPAASIAMPRSVDGLSVPPELPPMFASSQPALMAASNALAADFCPICEACRDGVCPTEGAAA
ncbi:type VI secretion system tip protein VgrG [Pseudomonas migulae]|uniref:Type VI secretion system secreted protein VgrG n=1 Tax=Pseudomonas migulae TaxID=78543 RepID=A0A1H5IWS7_9PSED|nr:type VI secretion system tip protein VgrG [Pseudomonas migulae]SEE44624.1 type VI secretion system secreted protein VgrG [Pseudomonas migulae]